jgi:hypothetical protein
MAKTLQEAQALPLETQATRFASCHLRRSSVRAAHHSQGNAHSRQQIEKGMMNIMITAMMGTLLVRQAVRTTTTTAALPTMPETVTSDQRHYTTALFYCLHPQHYPLLPDHLQDHLRVRHLFQFLYLLLPYWLPHLSRSGHPFPLASPILPSLQF